MAAEYTPLTGAPVDGPQVAEAMRVYDGLNAGEQRQIFLTLARAIAAYRETKDIDRLVGFAESIEGMVRLEAQPGLREALRNRPTAAPEPGEGISFDEAIKRLQE